MSSSDIHSPTLRSGLRRMFPNEVSACSLNFLVDQCPRCPVVGSYYYAGVTRRLENAFESAITFGSSLGFEPNAGADDVLEMRWSLQQTLKTRTGDLQGKAARNRVSVIKGTRHLTGKSSQRLGTHSASLIDGEPQHAYSELDLSLIHI